MIKFFWEENIWKLKQYVHDVNSLYYENEVTFLDHSWFLLFKTGIILF